jgi:hypothetical protein
VPRSIISFSFKVSFDEGFGEGTTIRTLSKITGDIETFFSTAGTETGVLEAIEIFGTIEVVGIVGIAETVGGTGVAFGMEAFSSYA